MIVGASAPLWEFVRIGDVNCDTVNSTAITCVKIGSQSDERGKCNAVRMAEE